MGIRQSNTEDKNTNTNLIQRHNKVPVLDLMLCHRHQRLSSPETLAITLHVLLLYAFSQ